MISKSSKLSVILQAIILSSLMLTRPQKSPTPFYCFEKDSSPSSDGTTQVEIRQLKRISQGNDQ